MKLGRWLIASAVAGGSMLGVSACGNDPDAVSPPSAVVPASTSLNATADAFTGRVEQELTTRGFKVVRGSVGSSEALPLVVELDLGCADGKPRQFAVWGDGTEARPYLLEFVEGPRAEFEHQPTPGEARQYNLCS